MSLINLTATYPDGTDTFNLNNIYKKRQYVKPQNLTWTAFDNAFGTFITYGHQVFSDDGTKLYVMRARYDYPSASLMILVGQWNLLSAYDTSSIEGVEPVHTLTHYDYSLAGDYYIKTMAINSTGTLLTYIINGYPSPFVTYQISMSTPYSLSTGTVSQVDTSKISSIAADLGAQGTGFTFVNNGNKLAFAQPGASGGVANAGSITLNTPYNTSTAVVSDVLTRVARPAAFDPESLGLNSSRAQGIFFANNGSKAYLKLNPYFYNLDIAEFTCSTPYNMSTASYVRFTRFTQQGGTYSDDAYAAALSNNGTTLYALYRDASNNTGVYFTNLSTAYNMSTAGTWFKFAALGYYDTGLTEIKLERSGYLQVVSSNRLYSVNLSTGATTIHEPKSANDTTAGMGTARMRSCAFNSNGTKVFAYLSYYDANNVYRHKIVNKTLATAYDLSSIESQNSGVWSNPVSLSGDNDRGDARIYFANSTGTRIGLLSLQTDLYISSGEGEQG